MPYTTSLAGFNNSQQNKLRKDQIWKIVLSKANFHDEIEFEKSSREQRNSRYTV